jgi:hypothetical protein
MPEPEGLRGWIELFRSLGQALFEVLRAEGEALGEDLRRSGSRLLKGLILFGAAAAIGFWTTAVLVLALIAVAAIRLPLWAAALVVAALFGAAAGLLALLGWRQLRQLESPAASIRRRVQDHLDWWEHRLLAEPGAAAVPEHPQHADRLAGASGDVAPAPARPAGRPRIHPDDPLEEDDL